MLTYADWTSVKDTHFTLVVDLPGLLDPGSGMYCPLTAVHSPVVDFVGEDFATDDAGIIGKDLSRRSSSRGISIYDFASRSRMKIVDSGDRPDWSN